MAESMIAIAIVVVLAVVGIGYVWYVTGREAACYWCGQSITNDADVVVQPDGRRMHHDCYLEELEAWRL